MRYFLNLFLVFFCTLMLLSCKGRITQNKPNRIIGELVILDNEALGILSKDSKAEVLDSGYIWVEGPLWLEQDSSLLFSDVKQNRIYKWKDGQQSRVYMEQSGLSENTPYFGNEPGSNGLMLNQNGELVLAQHGNRQLALMDAPIMAPESKFKTLVNNYQDKKLNSPNDIIQDKAGNYYFTDPIFGLGASGKAELEHRGVYKLSKKNELFLLVSDLDGPNGLALTPDEKYLLVANTSKERGILYAYELDSISNTVKSSKEAYNFSSEIAMRGGVLDGLAIDKKGNIFLTGPSGLWILNKDYKPLARLEVSDPISNCTLSTDEKTLYLTNTDKILRLRLK